MPRVRGMWGPVRGRPRVTDRASVVKGCRANSHHVLRHVGGARGPSHTLGTCHPRRCPQRLAFLQRKKWGVEWVRRCQGHTGRGASGLTPPVHGGSGAWSMLTLLSRALIATWRGGFHSAPCAHTQTPTASSLRALGSPPADTSGPTRAFCVLRVPEHISMLCGFQPSWLQTVMSHLTCVWGARVCL